jgi:hypothetical protein
MTRLTFLFWNLNQRPLGGIVTSLAIERSVDVVLLAENSINPADLLHSLNASRATYHFLPSVFPRIAVFSRLSPETFAPVFEHQRFVIRRLSLPDAAEVLVVAAHLPDKRNFRDDAQAEECSELSRRIRRIEDERGHERTILVGDLNANPHELGLIGTYRLNATMSRRVAGREERTVQGASYPFFFNPMWSKYNDGADGPPATYYYTEPGSASLFWHMFDQVLVRPALLPGFETSEVDVIHRVGSQSLLRNGVPDTRLASDHLPIVFSIELS